jgi:hypothetical protein
MSMGFLYNKTAAEKSTAVEENTNFPYEKKQPWMLKLHDC